eukprot:8125-Heterococcus_DN1.PRE.3
MAASATSAAAAYDWSAAAGAYQLEASSHLRVHASCVPTSSAQLRYSVGHAPRASLLLQEHYRDPTSLVTRPNAPPEGRRANCVRVTYSAARRPNVSNIDSAACSGRQEGRQAGRQAGRKARSAHLLHFEIRVLNLFYFFVHFASAMQLASAMRAWNFLAKAVATITAVALLVSLFSFNSQTLQSPSRHDIFQAGEADVPTVAYAISLIRVPEGLESHTFLDAVEVSEQHLRSRLTLSHDGLCLTQTINNCRFPFARSRVQVLGHSIDSVCAKSTAYKCEKVAFLAPNVQNVLHLQALRWNVLVRDVPLNVSTVPAGEWRNQISTSDCCGGE